MKDPDIMVIGGGLFGCIIADALMYHGADSVEIVDCEAEHRGSDPAACLMKPSWYAGLGKEVHEPALALLDELYGVEEIKFRVAPMITAKVNWVPPERILLAKGEYTRRRVEVQADGTVVARDWIKRPRVVIVAAGVWTNSVLPEGLHIEGLTGRAGCAFTWKGRLKEPFIRPWAPYRQLVAFNRAENEIWVGDGTAIKPENWSEERRLQSLKRCADAVGLDPDKATSHYGIRPYVPGVKPCVIARQAENLWAVTGGAKNGTISAAFAAQVVSQEVLGQG